jgi:hypothetical protein
LYSSKNGDTQTPDHAKPAGGGWFGGAGLTVGLLRFDWRGSAGIVYGWPCSLIMELLFYYTTYPLMYEKPDKIFSGVDFIGRWMSMENHDPSA